MRYLQVADDATVAELEAAITELRKRQRQCVLEISVAGIGAEINELFDRRALALLELEPAPET
jgi:hypothetical protein